MAFVLEDGVGICVRTGVSVRVHMRRGMRSITNNKGEGNHIEQPTGNAVPKLAANSCGKLH